MSARPAATSPAFLRRQGANSCRSPCARPVLVPGSTRIGRTSPSTAADGNRPHLRDPWRSRPTALVLVVYRHLSDDALEPCGDVGKPKRSFRRAQTRGKAWRSWKSGLASLSPLAASSNRSRFFLDLLGSVVPFWCGRYCRRRFFREERNLFWNDFTGTRRSAGASGQSQ